MEIQLASSDVKLVIKLNGQSYEMRKPKVGLIKAFESMRVTANNMEAMQFLICGMGLPEQVFNDLELNQLEQISNAVTDLITPKKN